jgi:hypothetical protein
MSDVLGKYLNNGKPAQNNDVLGKYMKTPQLSRKAKGEVAEWFVTNVTGTKKDFLRDVKQIHPGWNPASASAAYDEMTHGGWEKYKPKKAAWGIRGSALGVSAAGNESAKQFDAANKRNANITKRLPRSAGEAAVRTATLGIVRPDYGGVPESSMALEAGLNLMGAVTGGGLVKAGLTKVAPGVASKLGAYTAAKEALPTAGRAIVGAGEGVVGNTLYALPGGLVHGDFKEQATNPVNIALGATMGAGGEVFAPVLSNWLRSKNASKVTTSVSKTQKTNVPKQVIQAWDQMNVIREKQKLPRLDITNPAHHKIAIEYGRGLDKQGIPVERALPGAKTRKTVVKAKPIPTNRQKALPARPDVDIPEQVSLVEREIANTQQSIDNLNPLLENWANLKPDRQESVVQAFDQLHYRLNSLEEEHAVLTNSRAYNESMVEAMGVPNGYDELFAPLDRVSPVKVNGKNVYSLQSIVETIAPNASPEKQYELRQELLDLITTEGSGRREVGKGFGEGASDYISPLEIAALKRATGAKFVIDSPAVQTRKNNQAQRDAVVQQATPEITNAKEPPTPVVDTSVNDMVSLGRKLDAQDALKESYKPGNVEKPVSTPTLEPVDAGTYTKPYNATKNAFSKSTIKGKEGQRAVEGGIFGEAQQDLFNAKTEVEAKIEEVKKRIASKGSRLNIGVDPTLLYDAAELGYNYIKLGVMEFEPWAKRMVAELGDAIQPHLKKIWDNLNSGGDVDASWNRIKTSGFADDTPKVKTAAPKAVNAQQSANPSDDAVTRLVDALKQFKKKEPLKREMFRQQRGERFSKAKAARGNPGISPDQAVISAKSSLKGELDRPKVDLPGFEAEHWETLKNTLRESGALSSGEWLSAEEGLRNLVLDGKFPQPKQRLLLGKVFGDALMDALSEAKPWYIRAARRSWIETNGVLRALQNTADWSWTYIQGYRSMVLHPKLWGQGLKEGAKAFFDPKVLEELHSKLRSDPLYDDAIEAGLFLPESQEKTLQALRDDPWTSQLITKIPGIGTITRASQRHWTAMSNTVRFGIFKKHVELLERNAALAGRNGTTPRELRDAAKYANIVTARGHLGKLENAADVVGAPFYSLRNLVSQIQQPAAWIYDSPVIRKQVIKDNVKLAVFMVAALESAKMAGLDTETDWRSSDVGKIRFGNTRVDVTGGFGQFVRVVGQVITGERKNAATGAIERADRISTVGRWLSYKAAPPISMGFNLLEGKTPGGEPYTLKQPGTVARQTLVPLVIQDIWDAYDDAGMKRAAWVAPLAFMGGRVQTYEPETKTSEGMPAM